jgi:hypothetical protein
MPGMSVPPSGRPHLNRDEAAEEQLNPTGEGNEAHVGGKICKHCGQVIQANQDARLTGVNDWVHDVCPVVIG